MRKFIETEDGKNWEIIFSEYEKMLEWFHSFMTDSTGERYKVEKSQGERLQEYKAQIKRMRIFLDFIGNPQDNFLSVHIAGTGGKGSTSMMIGKILEGMSARVGVHTSPFLQIPGEKFLINGQMIAPSKFVEVVQKLKISYEKFKKVYPDIDLKYAEIWVAFTYLYFGISNLNWAVIETGMGGRFDPTNILNPELSVITNINFDHVPQLGTTIPEIAWHKAGIIKPGKPIITGEDKEGALRVFREETERNESELYCFGSNFSWKLVSKGKIGAVIDVRAPYNNYEKILIPLLGVFQVENAALAIATVDIIAHKHNLQIDSSIINEQFQEINFPGRMEIIQNNPTVILDGAHNPQKMAALAKSMRELYPDKKYILICGMLGTKDSRSSIVHLLSQAEKVVISKPQVAGKPGMEARDLAKIVRETGYQGEIKICPEISLAITEVLEKADSEAIVLITGSLYMLGEAREYWIRTEDLLLQAEKHK